MFDFLKSLKTPTRSCEAAASALTGGEAAQNPQHGGVQAAISAHVEGPDVALKNAKKRIPPKSAQSVCDKSRGTPRFATGAASETSSRKAPPHTPRHLQGNGGNSFQTPLTTPRTAPDPASCRPYNGHRDATPSTRRAHTPAENHDSVKILVRVRPFNENEVKLGSHSSIAVHNEHQLSLLPHSDASQYVFDRIIRGDSSQTTVFEAAGKAVVDSCFSGYNACVFAYGQTGSGKTFTMLGDIPVAHARLSHGSGLIPRIFDHLLSEMARREKHLPAGCEQLAYECHLGMLEIYNETLTDLLNPEAANLQIREDVQHGIRVESLSQIRVSSVADVLMLLDEGTKNRHIGETRMNRESSRSHCVLICSIQSRKCESGLTSTLSSRLNLVDLAGSEQQKASGASGGRLREAANINKSLSILGRVINSLSAQQKNGARAVQHVPYRDSKLTFLLQDSLGGNSRTVMIANISPSTQNITETQSTLRFAQRAKKMGNKAVINETASGDIDALRKEVVRLKKELASHQTMHQSSGQLACVPAGLQTPPLAAQGLSEVLTPQKALSPHSLSVSALVHAVERAKQAETRVLVMNEKCNSLEAQSNLYHQERMKRSMMEKFREAQLQQLERAVQSGKVEGAEQLICDTIEKLKAKVYLLETQRDVAKAEAHVCRARVNELHARLAEADRISDVGKQGLQRQVHSLQNLLLLLRIPNEVENPSDDAGQLGLQADAQHSPLEAAVSASEDRLTSREWRFNSESGLNKAQHAAHQGELQLVEERWKQELARVRSEFEAREARAQQQLDDNGRIHNELIQVRGELAEARTESEALYHQQLLPIQREVARLREEKASDTAALSEMQEQLSEFRANLQIVTESKVSGEEKMSELRRVLEQYQVENADLRARVETQAADISEHTDKAAVIANTLKHVEDFNRTSTELIKENADLQWEVTRLKEARRATLRANAAQSSQEQAAQAVEALQQERDSLLAQNDMLNTETQALRMQLDQREVALRKIQDEHQHELSQAEDALRASEYQRMEEQRRSQDANRLEREQWCKEKGKLQVCLSSKTEELLASRQSASDLETALRMASVERNLGNQNGSIDSGQLLRDYAQLAGHVMQLAAYMLAEDAGLQASLGSNENHDRSNHATSELLSPGSAALALKKGTFGSSVGRNEQWDKIARMVSGTGQVAPVNLLGDGHTDLKSIVTDLLFYLNGEWTSC